jgi:hypothetical protein
MNGHIKETHTMYEYTLTDDLSFELCATFARETSDIEKYQPTSYPMISYGDTSMDYWNHSAGHVCFARTIDPELYHTEAIVK